MNTAISRDIVATRFVYNLIQRNTFRDTLKDAVVGDYRFSALSTPDHLGWLKCDGRSLSRTTYSALFNIIGTSFGADNGTTFKLPDCQGRVPGAIGSGSGLTTRALGSVVGAETHTLSINEIPSHNHGGNTGSAGYGTGVASPAVSLSTMDVADNSGSHSHTIASEGGGQAHNNMQPTIFLGNVYIYSGVRDPDEPDVDITGPNDTEYPPQ